MNTRDYKIFRAGEYYHVYNRGNNKEPIFLDEQDFFNFLKRLKIALGISSSFSNLRMKPLLPGQFCLLAYCLMGNHFHFLIKQEKELPIGFLIRKVSISYAKYFNAKYQRVGNLFQDTFKAKHVDSDSYLTYLSAYIHNNPAEPFTYVFSSLPEYLGRRNGTICDPTVILKYFENDTERYKQFVQSYSYRDHTTIKHLVFDEE